LSAPTAAVTVDFDELPEATLPEPDPAATAAAISRGGGVSELWVWRPWGKDGAHIHVNPLP